MLNYKKELVKIMEPVDELADIQVFFFGEDFWNS